MRPSARCATRNVPRAGRPGLLARLVRGAAAGEEGGFELDDLFTRVVVAIAGGLTGLDADTITASRGEPQQEGVLGDIARLFLPASSGRFARTPRSG